MPIETRCISCGKQLRAPDQFAGKNVKCPGCGSAVALPAAGQVVVKVVPVAQSKAAANQPKATVVVKPVAPQASAPARPNLDGLDSLLQASGDPFALGAPLPGPRPVARRPNPWLKIGLLAGGGIGALSIVAALVVSLTGNSADVPDTGLAVPGPAAPGASFARPAAAPNTTNTGAPAPAALVPQWTRKADLEQAELQVAGTAGQPGAGMKMYLYRPAGQHQPQSLPCVFIAPAGATVLSGMSLGDGDRSEHYPWALAGYAVISYDIDGDVGDLTKATVDDLKVAFQKFSAASAGLANARLAMRTALASCPEIDPRQLYVAGHSSAGTLALIVAENEPNLRGCIAFAPVSNMVERASDGGGELFRLVPGSEAFAKQYSPHLHGPSFGCPLFLFHAIDDDNVPFKQSQDFSNQLQQLGKTVKLELAGSGGHYNGMVSTGVPHAIQWLKQMRAREERATAASSPQVQPSQPAPAQPSAAGPVAGGAVPLPPGFEHLLGRRDKKSTSLAPAPSPARWEIKPDGVEPASVDWGDRKPRVPIDGDFHPKNVGLTANPSPLIAVRDPERSVSIWNLATARRVAQLKTKGIDALEALALSDDGKYLAGVNWNSFEVWSCATAKRVVKTAHEGLGEQFMQFAGPEHVVCSGEKDHKKALLVYTTPAGECVASIDLNDHFFKIEQLAVSPGGRYLAVLDKTLKMIELASGEVVGEVGWPKAQQAGHLLDPTPVGCAFSPDGKRLVTLCRASRDALAIVWNVQTGEVVEHVPIDDEGLSFGVHSLRPIQWSPDQKHWLLHQRAVASAQTGDVLWPAASTKPGHQSPAVPCYVDNDRVLVIGGTGFKRTATIELLSPERLEKMAAAAAAGGEAVDGLLPPLTPAKLNSGQVCTPFAKEAAWTAEPDPAPSGKLGRLPLELKSKGENIRRVILSAPAAAKAIVLSAPETAQASDSAPQARLERYDLAAGTFQNVCELPAVLELSSVSADGTLAVTTLKNRIDVWSLDEGKPVASWRLPGEYSGEEKVWTGVIDNRHLATRDAVGQLVVWNLPDYTAAYRVDGVGAAELSPGRNQLIALSTGNRRPAGAVLDALTGQCQGTFEDPRVYAQFHPHECACAADGSRVAAGDGRTFVCWDLATGKIYSEFAQSMLRGLRFVGRDHVLAQNHLVDLRLHCVALEPRGPSRDPELDKVIGDVDDRLWTIAQPARGERGWLAYVEMPPAGLARQLAATPEPSAILGPGSEVAVEFQAAGLPHPTLQTAVDNCTRQLEAAGVRVAAGAALKFVAEIRVVKQLDLQLEFTPLGRARLNQGPQTITLPLKQEELRIKLVDASGSELWNMASSAASRLPRGMIKVPPDETPQAYLERLSNENREHSLTNFFSNPSLPSLVYPQQDKVAQMAISDKLLLGSSASRRTTPGTKDQDDSERPPKLAAKGGPPQDIPTQELQPDRPMPQLPLRAGRRSRRPMKTAQKSAPVKSDGSQRKLVRERYVDLLAGSPDEFLKQLRWLPATKRPSLGSRWGIALSMTGGPRADSEQAIVKLTGPAGQALLDALNERIGRSDFGDWPDYGDGNAQQLAVLSGEGRTELMSAARDVGVQFVLLLTLRLQQGPSKNKPLATLDARILDVGGASSPWVSSPLTNEGQAADVEKSAYDWVDSLVNQIDDVYKLQPLPDLDAKQVSARVQELNKKKPLDVWSALVEVRCYQLKGLIDADQAGEVFAKLLGESGKALAGDDAAARRAALDKLADKP